ncbi:hypothetical protein PsYK624_060710 [Phanerochaete sordida]|uniref:Uncharacterized protein n=1 Tax=Phanerochaete sordida TaxID=48140 RepID=A0A9P3G826_9APHY|nr:hypothetical protein PsYK624_060710 [Phanerochaete sordida]
MHRISDVRVGGISRQNFNLFRQLCGDATLGNVVIVTNMWNEVQLERGEARETELSTGDVLFGPAIRAGAKMERHNGMRSSAEAVLTHILGNDRQALLIQTELVDLHMEINETSAGKELSREHIAMRERYSRELAAVAKRLQQALDEKDAQTETELAAARDALEGNIKALEHDRERLSEQYSHLKTQGKERSRGQSRLPIPPEDGQPTTRGDNGNSLPRVPGSGRGVSFRSLCIRLFRLIFGH